MSLNSGNFKLIWFCDCLMKNILNKCSENDLEPNTNILLEFFQFFCEVLSIFSHFFLNSLSVFSILFQFLIILSQNSLNSLNFFRFSYKFSQLSQFSSYFLSFLSFFLPNFLNSLMKFKLLFTKPPNSKKVSEQI